MFGFSVKMIFFYGLSKNVFFAIKGAVLLNFVFTGLLECMRRKLLGGRMQAQWFAVKVR